MLSILFVVIFIFIVSFSYQIFLGEKNNKFFNIIIIISISYTLEGFRKILTGYFLFKYKNLELTVLTVTVGAFNILLNVLLIDSYGITGAAFSTIITYSVLLMVMLLYILKLNVFNILDQ